MNHPPKYTTMTNNQHIEFQKKQFCLLHTKNHQGGNLLPMNYLELSLDLLMNVIESRQKILMQHLKFDNDYKQLFLLDVDDANDINNDHDVLKNNDNDNMKRS